MMQTAQRLCPICGANQVEGLHTQHFELPEGHPLANGYEVVACSACGFVYADTPVTQAAYDSFYARFSKYEDARTGTGGGETPWDKNRLEQTACMVADFLQNQQARILDVGCANGGLLNALKNLGYTALVGLDPSPACVANTRRLGIDAYKGSLFQPFPVAEFDCVLLSHTLEHVQDLERAMDIVKNVLRRDSHACIYVEVPDASRYQDFISSPFQDFNTEHINHFSLASLENLMRIKGFRGKLSGEKTLESSPNHPYPAIYIFAHLYPGSPEPLIKDTGLKKNIETYIKLSCKLMADMDLRLQQTLKTYPRLIIWGTGQLVMKLLVETCLGCADIIAFVDSNPINQGRVLHGVEIISPEAVRGLPDPIVITSTLHQQSIAAQIHQMGLPNPLIFLQD
jgi:SAM-dependent methyltransferase